VDHALKGRHMLKRVCVYAGSSAGAQPAYLAAARELGQTLVTHGLGLVYGGSRLGLMGALADAVLAGGGEVVGIIPQALAAREVAHDGLTELRVVSSMHQRKAQMTELADAFVALPGGLGTLDEFFETLTWAQLGLHAKPIGLLDVAAYYGPLLALVAHATSEGFIPRGDGSLLVVDREPERLIARLEAYQPPPLSVKWITPEEA
jgi:uncharacterized protein (TIGR00730 family)